MDWDYYSERGAWGGSGGCPFWLNVDALTLFILGVGVLVLVLGPCLGLYGFGPGLVGLVISGVLAVPLRLYLRGLFRREEY